MSGPRKPSDYQAHSELPTTLWLIRHAEVEEKYQGVFGGQIDMDLSARGHQQAASLAKYVQQLPMDALYASPMKRVQQTLAPCLQNGVPKPVIMPGLKEVDFGVWTALNFAQVQEKFGVNVSSWLDEIEQGRVEKGESAATFGARVEPCLREILARHAGQRVTIACHGGVIRMMLAILLDWPLSRMAAFEFDYASVTQVLWRPPQARLQLVNFTPWSL
jgi:broad specificity phosphatase PhoE